MRPRAHRHRRFLKLAIVLGILAVFLTPLWWLLTADEPPPEDGDLMPSWVEVPVEENGYWLLKLEEKDIVTAADLDNEAGEDMAALLESLAIVDNSVVHKFDSDLDEMLAGRSWNPGLAATLLERNAGALARFHQTLERPNFQCERARSVTDLGELFMLWWTLSTLVRVQAWEMCFAGGSAEAARECLKVVRFGSLLETSSSYVGAICGVRVTHDGLETLRGIAAEPGINRSILLDAARELALRLFKPEDMAQATRAGHAARCLSLGALAAGAPLKGLGPVSWADQSRLYFKPNQTHRLLADATRRGLERILESGSSPSLPAHSDDLDLSSFLVWRNLTGLRFIYWLGDTPEGAVDFFREGNADLALTQAFLALRAYHADRGALPARFDDLVPDYLDSVPVDPFAGQPIRYSREKEIVYSIGVDLLDSGGLADIDYGPLEDPNELVLPLFSDRTPSPTDVAR